MIFFYNLFFVFRLLHIGKVSLHTVFIHDLQGTHGVCRRGYLVILPALPAGSWIKDPFHDILGRCVLLVQRIQYARRIEHFHVCIRPVGFAQGNDDIQVIIIHQLCQFLCCIRIAALHCFLQHQEAEFRMFTYILPDSLFAVSADAHSLKPFCAGRFLKRTADVITGLTGQPA